MHAMQVTRGQISRPGLLLINCVVALGYIGLLRSTAEEGAWGLASSIVTEITSKLSKAFKQLMRLGKSRPGRRKAHRFLAEGETFLRMRPRTVFIRRSRWVKSSGAIEAAIQKGGEEGPLSWLDVPPLDWGGGMLQDDGLAENDPKVCVLANDLFDRVSTQEKSQGIICVFPMPPSSQRTTPGARAVVLDGVEDPNNLGVILRTMEAFGTSTLISLKGTVDIFNSKVVRCSMGAIVRGKVQAYEVEDAFGLRSLLPGHRIFATSLAGTLSPNGLVEEITGKEAFVFGNEARGVSKQVLEIADRHVRIPMIPGVDSLNVGVSVGIVLHAAYADAIEALRPPCKI